MNSIRKSELQKKRAQAQADVEMVAPGQRKDKDRAAIFRLVGGPYHDKFVRLYAPWDTLVFPDGEKYELAPPHGRYKHWVYVSEQSRDEKQREE